MQTPAVSPAHRFPGFDARAAYSMRNAAASFEGNSAFYHAFKTGHQRLFGV